MTVSGSSPNMNPSKDTGVSLCGDCVLCGVVLTVTFADVLLCMPTAQQRPQVQQAQLACQEGPATLVLLYTTFLSSGPLLPEYRCCESLEVPV